MKRIYIAGAISDDSIIESLGNIRRGLQLSVKALKEGYAVFPTFCDFQFSLIEEISLEAYYNSSIAWLEVSDAVLVVAKKFYKSKGTTEEILKAIELGISVFWNLKDLIGWDRYGDTSKIIPVIKVKDILYDKNNNPEKDQ